MFFNGDGNNKCFFMEMGITSAFYADGNNKCFFTTAITFSVQVGMVMKFYIKVTMEFCCFRTDRIG